MKTAKEAKSKGQGARSRKFLLIKVFNCPRHLPYLLYTT